MLVDGGRVADSRLATGLSRELKPRSTGRNAWRGSFRAYMHRPWHACLGILGTFSHPTPGEQSFSNAFPLGFRYPPSRAVKLS